MTINRKTLQLSERDRALLNGAEGEAMQFAMQVVVRAAEIMRAPYLIDVSFVHIDACHYNGRAHVDFAQYFVDHGVKFKIPAWTNTLPINLIQPELRDSADEQMLTEARYLTTLYSTLGCRPVWTCAPYQLPGGPAFGDQIIGSESNAVAYYNSVVGARTNKYGDFFDVCTGLVQRAPWAGLHTDEGRRGNVLIDLTALPEALRQTEIFCHVLGHLMGNLVGSAIPVIKGLPKETTADSLKAISAAGASSGGIAMFHAVGITPEAPTVEAAFQGDSRHQTITVTPEMIIEARDSLSSATEGSLNMVALGTPHFSYTEFERLVRLLDGRRVHQDVTFYVSTSRYVAHRVQQAGWKDPLQKAGVKVIVDTCTYFSPAVRACQGRVMTNSAKWAYYAPGMLPVTVAFGTLDDCVTSAVYGEIRRDDRIWNNI